MLEKAASGALNKANAATELLKRKRGRTSLEGFISYVNPNFVWADYHKVLCEELDKVLLSTEKGIGQRLMIFAPPRHSKSEIVSRMFPSYVIGRHPEWQLISTSYNDDFAQDFGRDVREIVKTKEFKTLFSNFELKADSQAVNKWRTKHGGIYVTAGVGGSITGRGAHIAIIDDPIKSWEEAKSAVNRDRIFNWFTTVLRTRMMPGGSIILMHTRWDTDDLAGRLLKLADEGGEKWKVISLPAIAGENDYLGRVTGEPLWAEWYPLTALESVKQALPAFQWAALYQQDPVEAGSTIFDRDWFTFYDKIEEPYKPIICADFAVTKDGDYTEIGVFGLSNDNIYILDWWFGRETPDIWIDHLINLIRRWNPSLFVGEAGQIRRSVEPFIQQAMIKSNTYTKLEWLSSTKSKEARLQSFIGLAAQGKIKFPKGVSWALRLIEQLLSFTGAEGKHDDAVDVFSLLGRIYPTVPLYFDDSQINIKSFEENEYLKAGW